MNDIAEIKFDTNPKADQLIFLSENTKRSYKTKLKL